MSIFTKTFSLALASEAAGMPGQTFKAHRHKGRLYGGSQEITGGGGPGQKSGYPITSIMQAAVAKSLIDDGVAPDRAFKAAALFAHTAEDGRQLSAPFKSGETILVVYRDGYAVMQGEGATLKDIRAAMRTEALSEPFLVVPCNPIFERVCQVLNYDDRDVMNEAYPEDAS